MLNTKYEKLSSLVLVDILAALPMESVVRMVRLGHERLRHACSLKWVKDRMTDVTFMALIRAHRIGGDVAATFSISSVMKRLHGNVAICSNDAENAANIASCLALAKTISGNVYLSLRSSDEVVDCVAHRNVENIRKSLGAQTKLTYLSRSCKHCIFHIVMIMRSPDIVFEYDYHIEKREHSVFYRPALLNGRHVVDVLRAVCGPADVSEEELNRVRREATENARRMAEDVWGAYWLGGAVTAQE